MGEVHYGWNSKDVIFDELNGLSIASIHGLEKDSEEVIFTLSDGRQFKMYHEQDCCESVMIADVCGDVDDLIGCEIVYFDERTSSCEDEGSEKPNDWSDSFTWTFYDIQTTKGCVNIRWLGESNGYYSESVSVKWPEQDQV